MWCSKSVSQTEKGCRSDCRSALHGSQELCWTGLDQELLLSTPDMFAILLWEYGDLEQIMPPACKQHPLSDLQNSVLCMVKLLSLPTVDWPPQQVQSCLFLWTKTVCQTPSVGAQLETRQAKKKNLVNSVCFPETETFLKTPLGPRGILMSRGECWTHSKVTKLFSSQLFTSKSKGRIYILMLREYSACHKAPGLWLISTLRCVSLGTGKRQSPGLCAQLV